MRRANPSFSLGSLGWCLFPQALHVSHRRDAEETFVLPIEVGSVLVADTRRSTCCVKIFAQHETTCLLKSQPLLELLGTQCRDRFETVLQTRDTHAQFACELLDAKRFVEVLEKELHYSSNGWGVAPRNRQVAESVPLFSHQKAIDDFSRHQRQEHPCFERRIHQPDKPQEGVQQVPIQEADIDGPYIHVRFGLRVTNLKQDLTDEEGGEGEA